MMEIHDIKRFVEWWIGDARFREKLKQDPWKTVREYGVAMDPEAVSVLCHVDFRDCDCLPKDSHPAVRAYNERIQAKIRLIQQLRKRPATGNTAFAKWRSRQMARLAGQTHDSSINLHPPFAIELTTGCSIQCNYCGVAPGPLRAIAHFTNNNERSFRDILHAFVEFLGQGADTGFLYHGTEPFDNPDYEKYLNAFHEELGRTPQTTTAAWFRDVSRTRRLLNQVKQRDGLWQRFSVNSADHLALCMKTFSARELEDVDLMIHHPGSLSPVISTGRGRHIPGAIDGTAGCVTGFLLNLPEKTVKLISPCVEPKQWPLGYRVFAESYFEDAANLQDFMRQCQAEMMEPTTGDSFVPRLRQDLRITEDKHGRISLVSRYRKSCVPEGLATELVKTIDGELNVNQIVGKLAETYGYPAVYYAIESWWEKGLFEDLDELPQNVSGHRL